MALNVCAMEEPLPSDAPETLVWTTVHVNEVPATLPDNEIAEALPEQIVCDAGVAVTTGFGLTETITLTGTPTQPADDEVIV